MTSGAGAEPRPEVEPPRLGFAGVGWIGRNRLEAVAASGAARIAAICVPSREAAEAARAVSP